MWTIQAHIFLGHGERAAIELALGLSQLFLLDWSENFFFLWDNNGVLGLFTNLLDSFSLDTAALTTTHLYKLKFIIFLFLIDFLI